MAKSLLSPVVSPNPIRTVLGEISYESMGVTDAHNHVWSDSIPGVDPAAPVLNQYDLIALEDLQILNMVQNHNLARSILDGGWGYLKQQLTFKAAEAGRELMRVAPAYTSKTCSNCGQDFVA